MRWLAIFLLVLALVPELHGQQQERSLIDRLLRPDMELQNRAQGKTFTANSKITERRGPVGAFYLQPKASEKSFADSRVVATSGHRSRTFYDGPNTDVPNKNRNANPSSVVTSSSVRDIHNTNDARKSVPGRDFADQHQFREEGKSQKSLNRQNPPLTIDQVRELLNKNK